MNQYRQGSVRKIVIIVAIAVLCVIVGIVAWVSANTPSNTATTKQPTQTTNGSATPSPIVDPATNTKYLTIKEWGMQLPLTSKTVDAYYRYANNDGRPTVYLSTAKLKRIANFPGEEAVFVISAYREGEQIVAGEPTAGTSSRCSASYQPYVNGKCLYGETATASQSSDYEYEVKAMDAFEAAFPKIISIN